MPEPLLTSLWQATLEAADLARIRYAIKGLFLLMLVLCIFVFLGAQTVLPTLRNVLSVIGLLFTFIANGIFVLGLAHLTARTRSCATGSGPLAAAFANFPAAVGAPALFAALVVCVLFAEVVFFSLGRLGSLGEVLISLAFMPLVLLNAGLLVVAAAGVWLAAAAACTRHTGAWGSFTSSLGTMRASPRVIFPAYLSVFAMTGLILFLVWTAMAFPVSLTLWTAQQATPGYELVLITGLPKFTMGALGPFGAALAALASGTSVSGQLANLVFLCMSLLIAAAAAAYPTVLLSEISMRISEAASSQD
ncbi:MAG: hypothetical protein ACE141_11270 [Bryobacteraceae bacterium]